MVSISLLILRALQMPLHFCYQYIDLRHFIVTSRVPPNCKFEVADAEDGWTFEPNSFDYIHLRTMGGAIKDWDLLLGRIKESLKPGGWLEIQEYEGWLYSDTGELPPENAIHEWLTYIDEASTKIGLRVNIAASYHDWVKKAGFENVKDDVYKVCE
jgi:hypothetical protein